MYSVSRLIQRRNSLLMSNGIQKNEQKRCNSFAQHEFLIQNSNNKDVELDAALAIPSLNITDPTRKPKVELALSGLCLGSRDVRLIQDIFIAEMCRGLVRESPQPSSLQMENTYIPELPDGSEDGQFLALDLGGTNSRVILLDLKDGVVQHELVSHFHVPEYLRVGSGQDLFDFLAQCVYDFVFDKGLMDRQLPLGFTFSFPMHQHALDCGVLVTWTKSFNCPSAVGRDTVAMLREAIARRGDLLVDVVAVLNDATGTLVQGAFLDKRTAIGLIIATGSNATYLEQADCIEKWEGERHGERKVIIDLEWGAFGDNGLLDFIKTDFDIEVDSESLLPNSFTFEKYISGKYLGDLVRIILLRLTLSDLLFNGNTSEHLLQPGSFTTRYISLIETDTMNGDSMNTVEILEDLGLSFGEDDIEIVKYVCQLASMRAALLVSVCVAGLLLWMNREDTTIAVDGSMFKFHPRLQSLMETYISVLAPNNKFQFLLAEDGSGKGAAVIAAIAKKLQTRRKQGM